MMSSHNNEQAEEHYKCPVLVLEGDPTSKDAEPLDPDKHRIGAEARFGSIEASLPSHISPAPHYDENVSLYSNMRAPLESHQGFLKSVDRISPLPLRRESSRGPLKKRPTSPVPQVARAFIRTPVPPPRSLVHPLHVLARPPPPLLRQSSPCYSVFSHSMHAPPQFGWSAAKRQHLMSQPLLQTPGMTPASSSSTGSSQGPVLTADRAMGSNYEGSRRDATPGLDLLAEQVLVNSHENHPDSHASQDETKQLVVSAPPLRVSCLSYPKQSLISSRDRPRSRTEVSPDVVPSVHEYIDSNTRNLVHMEQARAPPLYAPPKDMVAANPLLFAKAPSTCKPCACAHSKCLKLYCECFHSGVMCDSNLCKCKDCKNNPEHNTPRGPREYAILKILAKKPNAFHTKVKRRLGNWCKCKKNRYAYARVETFRTGTVFRQMIVLTALDILFYRCDSCLKKYCECVSKRRSCSDECKCRACGNVRQKK